MTSKTKTILACDDEPSILEILDYVVNKTGFNLLTAENGTDALRMAQQNIPDLILLDGNMPEMTGFEVCQILKNDDKTKDIIIVMLTANVQASDIDRASQNGANDFIMKPFSPKDLQAKLHELLD